MQILSTLLHKKGFILSCLELTQQCVCRFGKGFKTTDVWLCDKKLLSADFYCDVIDHICNARKDSYKPQVSWITAKATTASFLASNIVRNVSFYRKACPSQDIPLMFIAGRSTDIFGRLPLIWLVAGSRRWSWKQRKKTSYKAMRTRRKHNDWLPWYFPECSSNVSPSNLHAVASPCQSTLTQAFQMHHAFLKWPIKIPG